MDGIGRAGSALVGQGLQFELDLGDGLGVEQLAQLLGAQELPQQVTIEGQRLRPPIEQGRIAFVHVGRHVVEEQRARKGRGAAGLDADEVDLTALDGSRISRSAGRSKMSWRHSR